MDTTHDTPERDGRLVFIEPADTAPLTADERATLQTAFAALLRAGRPLFAPLAPGEVPGPLDPTDPGLDDRVRAILDRPLEAGESDMGGPSA